MTDPIIGAAVKELAKRPPSLGAYLQRHYDEIAKQLAVALDAGTTKRAFWDTLAAELSKAGVAPSRGGRMAGDVLGLAWRRTVQARAAGPAPPLFKNETSDNIELPEFVSVSGSRKKP